MNPTYAIGTSTSNISSVELLGIPIPMASPTSYSRLINLGDGSVRGGGWLKCEWRFAYLEQAELAILRSFCSGSSAEVVIKTLSTGLAYVRYSALMVWPDRELPKADAVYDFVLQFRRMVVV